MLFTCEVFGQVWVVHKTVTGKLYTLQSDRNMDVIKPLEKRSNVNTSNKRHLYTGGAYAALLEDTMTFTCPGNTARVVCSAQPAQNPWLQTSSRVVSQPAASRHCHYSAETGDGYDAQLLLVEALARSDLDQIHKHQSCFTTSYKNDKTAATVKHKVTEM